MVVTHQSAKGLRRTGSGGDRGYAARYRPVYAPGDSRDRLVGATVEAMSDALELAVRYEDAGEGWVTAQVLEVPGAISEGRGRAEARANVIDALRTVLTPDEQLAGEALVDSEPLMLTVSG